jgi:exodeoxyribonuclease VIII
MTKFNPDNPNPGKYLGIPNDVYHTAKGISNSGLMLIQNNPADYIWAQNAPKDFSKSKSIDLGTAIHAALLEPEKIEDIVIGPTKSRDTKAFTEYCLEHSDKTVLLQSEYDMLRLVVDSAMAHPSVNAFLSAKGDAEVSIFAHDSERDILCKIRPDKDLSSSGKKILIDVKTTRSIS